MALAAGCCILIVCAAILESGIGLPSFYNFSIVNKQNEAGRKLIEIHLNHEDGQIWDLEIDQSAGGTAAKIIPLNNEEVKCKLEKVDKDSNGLSRDVRTPGLGIYKIHNVKKNWTLAKEVCEHEGSHLMIINSEREVQSLDNLIENNNNSCDNKIFWIGIHDQYLEGEYITIFNETLESIGFSSWYPGDPDGSTNYNCGYYRYESTYKKGLRDGRCSSHLCFICEK